eukprot:gene9718-biopygen22749
MTGNNPEGVVEENPGPNRGPHQPWAGVPRVHASSAQNVGITLRQRGTGGSGDRLQLCPRLLAAIGARPGGVGGWLGVVGRWMVQCGAAGAAPRKNEPMYNMFRTVLWFISCCLWTLGCACVVVHHHVDDSKAGKIRVCFSAEDDNFCFGSFSGSVDVVDKSRPDLSTSSGALARPDE